MGEKKGILFLGYICGSNSYEKGFWFQKTEKRAKSECVKAYFSTTFRHNTTRILQASTSFGT